MNRTKAQQNIFDLTGGNLENLKEVLRANKLPLDTSYLPPGQILKEGGSNFTNAYISEVDLKCANDCWLCSGRWSAERRWYANCTWNTT